MANTDPRIDAYIQNSAEFAQPILTFIRAQIHLHCVDITETIKWGMPHFEYKGGIFCQCAAFKQHCGFGFWLGELLPIVSQHQIAEPGMGQFGRITSIKNLPKSKDFGKLCKQAMALHDADTKLPSRSKPKNDTKILEVPTTLMDAISDNAQALTTFTAFSYTKKKDYVEWYCEAKTDATRTKRLIQTVEWLAEGKSRHWKYEQR